MINTQELLNKKNFAHFIKTSAVLKKNKTIEKLFSEAGLSNFEVNSDNPSVRHKAAEKLIGTIFRRLHIFRGCKYRNDGTLQWRILHSYKKTGKLSLTDPLSVNKIQGKIGESLFKFENKCYNFYTTTSRHNNMWQALEQYEDFKEFSLLNSNNLKIVFSADGEEGIWDIATMSMRGIDSCQSWGGQFRNCLIGSMLDPYTGIIYLTSGSKSEFGTKMLARCVVRLITKGKQKAIFLDKMYPRENISIRDQFVKAIKTNIKDKKVKVILSRVSGFHIPYSSYISNILTPYNYEMANNKDENSYNSCNLSYRDTFIPFKLLPEDVVKQNNATKSALISAVKKKILTKFTFYGGNNAIISAIKELSVEINHSAYKNLIKNKLGSLYIDSMYVKKSKNTPGTWNFVGLGGSPNHISAHLKYKKLINEIIREAK